MHVLPLGTSPGMEGTSKENGSPTCDDEYLVIVAAPVEVRWYGEHLLFEVKAVVRNGFKGATVSLIPLMVSKVSENKN